MKIEILGTGCAKCKALEFGLLLLRGSADVLKLKRFI